MFVKTAERASLFFVLYSSGRGTSCSLPESMWRRKGLWDFSKSNAGVSPTCLTIHSAGRLAINELSSAGKWEIGRVSIISATRVWSSPASAGVLAGV